MIHGDAWAAELHSETMTASDVESVRSRFMDLLTKADQQVLAEIFERIEESLRKDAVDE